MKGMRLKYWLMDGDTIGLSLGSTLGLLFLSPLRRASVLSGLFAKLFPDRDLAEAKFHFIPLMRVVFFPRSEANAPD